MNTTFEPQTEQLTLVQRWRQQVAQTPHRVAVVTDTGQWSYQELTELADQFAWTLRQQGIGTGHHVGLCVDRSVEAIAAMLGIMQCGAAFVPLDPEYPPDRLAYMVADADTRTIIGHADYREAMGAKLWQQLDQPGHWIDCRTELASPDVRTNPDQLDNDPQPTDLAYIMYTSGSTGTPKGVEISHHALVTYCDADIECYRLQDDDRTLQFSTLCFDIAIEEIFPPLLSGSCVVVRPKGRADDRNELSSLIKRFDITAVHLATAYWHSWVDLMVASQEQVPESLRLVIATGEKVSVEHYHRWQRLCPHNVLWCNAYGPTEATVTSTVFVPTADFDADNMPIGVPLPGYTAFILDSDHHSVKQGETGELWIGGPALAEGYHKRPDLTEAAFVDIAVDGQSQRLYRTGDLARWLPDGNIDFAGRIDHQIKLGSYRIEPGEIEAAIDRVSGVLESLVSYDEVDGKKFLVAYIARNPTLSLTASGVASELRDALPPYMIPVRYVFLDSFPKTINGKLDRDALPSPVSGEVATAEDFEPPRTELEKELVDLWCDVLHLPQIGIHDDFFLLGGSSLLVTQVVTKLVEHLDIDLPVRDFFANPTVATAAAHIEKLLGKDDTDCSKLRRQADARRIRDRLPRVHPTFLPSGPDRLFCVRYEPADNRQDHAVVLAHSLGHEYDRGYRNLQQLAVQLAARGFDVLRCDYAGTGNSTGEDHNLTFESMQRNLLDASDFLQGETGCTDVSVVGLRLGASAALALDPHRFTRRLSWDPIVCGQSYLEKLEALHHRELTSLTRFNRRRIASPRIAQACGYSWPKPKRESIAGFTIQRLCEKDAIIQSVGSDDAVESLPGFNSKAKRLKVEDMIAWDDPRYTEAAFSSPASFRAIVSSLTNQNESAQGRITHDC